MTVYEDRISGAKFEGTIVLSSSYPITEIHNGAIYSVATQMVEGKSSGEYVIDVINEFSLVRVNNLEKEEYKRAVREYIVKVRRLMEEIEVEYLSKERDITEYIRTVIENFKYYDFYIAPNLDLSESILIHAKVDPESGSPTLYYFKLGLVSGDGGDYNEDNQKGEEVEGEENAGEEEEEENI